MLTFILISAIIFTAANAQSCTEQLRDLDCLPAYTHNPNNLPKCYCTERCPDITTLVNTCPSGQLHLDQCGICLRCALSFGDTCGGFNNQGGQCAGGYGCLIRFDHRRENEHNKTGVCVIEAGRDCRESDSDVSCRPGRIGVPAEFVFCPAVNNSANSCRNASRATNQFDQPADTTTINTTEEPQQIFGQVLGQGAEPPIKTIIEKAKDAVAIIFGED